MKYSVKLKLRSDKDMEVVQRFFVRAVELGKMDMLGISIEKVRPTGKPPVTRSKVVKWVSAQNRKRTFTMKEVADELGINRSTVWKTFARMVDAGMIEKMAEDPHMPYRFSYRRTPKKG